MTAAADAEPILVIDDDAQMRSVLSDQLEGAGYRCLNASGPQEARRLLAQDRCSLMVCDVNMPGESGLDLLRDVLSEHPKLATLMISGRDDAGTAAAATKLGAYGYMVKPFSANQLLTNVASALRRRDLELENRAHRDRLEELVERRALELGESVRRLERSTEELHRSREETIRRLSQAGEYRDEETGEHAQRVGRICYLIARHLGLEDDHCELIRVAGPLHDIGKVGIADSILRKPGRLTEEERMQMEGHAQIGYRILSGSDSPLLDMAATIAWTHHEKYDGSGYPRGLAGEEIPIEARIAALADVFDALTHDRVYRSALPLDEAIGILRSERSTHFDPQVIDAFLEALPEVAEIIGAASALNRGVKVLIVEDHESVRKGIELLLRHEGCEVVGTAGDAEHAYRLLQRRRPEVAVIDVGLPGESGIELTRRLLAEEGAPRVLLYTGVEDERSLQAGIEAGAAGIACKAGPPRELVAAIREVARGGSYFDPRLGSLLARSSPGAESVLTARERQILELLARGLSGEQIAAELFLSPDTVRTHVRNAMKKLAVRTRVHAVTEALRRREISL